MMSPSGLTRMHLLNPGSTLPQPARNRAIPILLFH